jgi:hypothetical protein
MVSFLQVLQLKYRMHISTPPNAFLTHFPFSTECSCVMDTSLPTLISWTLKMSLLHGNSCWPVGVLTCAQCKPGHGVTHTLGVSPPTAEPHPCRKHLGVVDHLYVLPSGPRHAVPCDVIQAGRLHVPMSACGIVVLSGFGIREPTPTNYFADLPIGRIEA